MKNTNKTLLVGIITLVIISSSLFVYSRHERVFLAEPINHLNLNPKIYVFPVEQLLIFIIGKFQDLLKMS